MLGGSLISSSFNDQDQDQDDPSTSDHHHHNITIPHPASAIHMRQLLITCAELLSRSDFPAAQRLLSFLSANSSPYGDSTERLVHQFARALSMRITSHHGSGSVLMMLNLNLNDAALPTPVINSSLEEDRYSSTSQSCYLSLNQITPFIRFSHLTANQAILEAIEVGQQAIHILDLDIMQGVQWPPLMQALAERSHNSLNPPPMLRITATGHDLNMLNTTGERLFRFAQSLGIRFSFHPLLVLNDDPASLALFLIPSALAILPDESLAVNCVLYLHRLIKDDDSRGLRLLLQKIKALNPTVVTVAEREGNHNHPLFLQRFVDALDHYTAIFQSLEATLPPNSRERLGVEQIWFGREIVDIVTAQQENRRERHERFEWWEMMMRGAGFSNVALSPFALSQAKLLLRLHYPSEGYKLQILNNSFFLGWHNRRLFFVSSWR
ncbi:scarecrow-like protein 18 [Carica papaya]|uniref:scarecrow-like protein 18 n=1 Tax=Carica papaya TaxID=3649 RepID=UPI000B8CB88C|nr:scarecrow-like protein 18 [Carica papaya]